MFLSAAAGSIWCFCFGQRGAGEEAPAVPAPGRKGHGSVPPGGRAGVGSEHQESHTEHAPDLPLGTGSRDQERGQCSVFIHHHFQPYRRLSIVSERMHVLGLWEETQSDAERTMNPACRPYDDYY